MLYAARQFTVETVECRGGLRDELRSHVAQQDAFVLVRSGRVGRRRWGQYSKLDATQGYLMHRGEEEVIQHLGQSGHSCTVITLRADGLPAALRARSRLAPAEFRTSPRVDLAHRRLTAGCRLGHRAADMERLGAEIIAELLELCRRAMQAQPTPAAQRLVDIAREAISADPAPLAVRSIAADAGVSPQQLARVFKSVTGMTMGHYRNRLRVRLALEHLAAGATNLSSLAQELGFFDHPHFSRTVAAELDLTPRQLRDLLGKGA